MDKQDLQDLDKEYLAKFSQNLLVENEALKIQVKTLEERIEILSDMLFKLDSAHEKMIADMKRDLWI